MLEDFPFLPSFPLPGSDLVGGMVFHPIKLELPNLNDEAYIASRIRSQRSYIFKKRRNWSIAKQSSPVRCSGGSKSSKFRSSYIYYIYISYIYIYISYYIYYKYSKWLVWSHGIWSQPATKAPARIALEPRSGSHAPEWQEEGRPDEELPC